MPLIARDFSVVFVLATIALIAGDALLIWLAGVDLGSAASFVPVIVGAVLSGQRYGVRTREIPSSATAWSAAGVMMVCWYALSLVALALIWLVEPRLADSLVAALGGVSPSLVIGMVTFITAIAFVTTRYLFGSTAKKAAIAAEKALQDRF